MQKLVVPIFTVVLTLGTALHAHAVGMTEATKASRPSQPKQPKTADSEESTGWSNSSLFSIFGQGISDRVEQTRSGGAGGVFDFKYKANEWLVADVRMLVLAQSGSAHALSAPSLPRSFFYPLNASVELIPIKYFAFEFGAIGQTQFANPLLMDVYSFPGFAEKLYFFKEKKAQVWFQANQSIPNSISLTNTSSENEALPTLLSHTLQVNYSPARLTKFRFSGGHWMFQNLPSQTAMESLPLGNTVDGNQYPNFRYRYGFQGWTASSSFETPIVRGLIPRVGGGYLVNIEAPEGRNQGYNVYGQVKGYVTPTWSVTPGAEWFVTESDASPAIYNLAGFDFNSTGFGHSNRQGYSVEFKVTHEPQKISLKGRYTDSRLLERNPFQADTQIFFMGLEIADVSFF
jgi:hypothetical protein